MKQRLSVILAILLLALTVFPALAQEPMVGEIRIWAGSSAPDGWQFCRGQKVNVSTYPDLYNVVGNSYVSGSFIPDVEFYLPDLQHRNPVGLGTQSNFDVLGETGGVISHTLTTSQLPAHQHTTNANIAGAAPNTSGVNIPVLSGVGGVQQGLTHNTGGGQPHQILDPYLTVNFIIFTGVYSATPTPTPTPTETPTPTATPTGSVTPTSTPNTTYLPMIVTTTLQSGTVLSVPEQVSFGQIITSALVLSLIAAVALDFIFRFVYRR